MYAMLQQVDPAAAEKIHSHQYGHCEHWKFSTSPVVRFQSSKESIHNYPILQLGWYADPAALTRRIEHRTEQMLAAGWVAE